ncbi:MAG: nicotinate (nicotinamide) nucleotide adenylyltransferase [Pseudomonadota bacterium]
MSKLRAIFGGTFNPVHNGHIGAIKQLDGLLGFHSVHFVLSARPPHKDEVTATIEQRFSMLELALLDYPHYYPDDAEIRRKEKSYTVDTVETFKRRYPNSRLVIVIGLDSLQRLSTWHLIDDWIDQINWVVLDRPGYELTESFAYQSRLTDDLEELKSAEGGKIWQFQESKFNISSTELRQKLASDYNIDRTTVTANTDSTVVSSAVVDNLNPQVLEFIHFNDLYKTK